jgi:thiamine-phosphate pyrophosphorylase
MRPEVDWSVYLVTDRRLAGTRDLRDIVAAAVAGGVSVVQLREKNADTRRLVDLAEELHAILQPRGVPLIINDRLDVALAVGAEGVHVGQTDMPWATARRLLGPEALLGVSVETPEQAAALEGCDVDYLGVSPVFATPTKTDTGNPWGLDGLRRLRSQTSHHLVAIGGISAANAADVVRAGADGVAVVSAICAAEDPKAAAEQLGRVAKKR